MYKVHNVFTQEQLSELKNTVYGCKDTEIQEELGRINISNFKISDSMKDRLLSIVGDDLSLTWLLAVTYDKKYGEPELPPHFDGDSTDIIVDFQLEANTRWDLAANTTVYQLEDNSALVMHPNKVIHWRPHKEFQDGEYVTMVFFRFQDLSNMQDYAHMSLERNDPIFNEAKAVRDSI